MIVKVCGLRDRHNIKELASAHIDWMGFIFYEGSSRYAGANDLENWLPTQRKTLEGIKRVGVFVNASIEDILNRTHDFELDLIQLHGDESPEYVQEVQLLWRASNIKSAQFIKAFGLDPDFEFEDLEPYQDICDYFLFDTKHRKQRGGTGQQFDWSLLARYRGATPFLLSGGIDIDAVPAVRALGHPQLVGVDINSRFERAPGLKDVPLVELFNRKIKA